MDASSDSVRLCGGILVAIPTAIPDAPFTRRFGILAGEHSRFRQRVVEVWNEIHGILVQIAQISSPMRASFASVYRMAAGRVTVDRAEVTLSEHERDSATTTPVPCGPSSDIWTSLHEGGIYPSPRPRYGPTSWCRPRMCFKVRSFRRAHVGAPA